VTGTRSRFNEAERDKDMSEDRPDNSLLTLTSQIWAVKTFQTHDLDLMTIVILICNDAVYVVVITSTSLPDYFDLAQRGIVATLRTPHSVHCR